jgi:prepilin-type N-terminal cleavage/methylation domain-containing protein
MLNTARYAHNTSEKGFTLLELLVVITILVAITAAAVPSFAGYIRNQGIRQATEQLKSDLRSIQNKALTGALSDQEVNSNPVAYWGVRFSAGGGSGTNRYEYFISDTATTCPSSFTTGQVQGYAELASTLDIRSSGYKCLYFSMANGSITPINFGSSNVLIVGLSGSTKDGDCRRLLFNTGGLIYTGTSLLCT